MYNSCNFQFLIFVRCARGPETLQADVDTRREFFSFDPKLTLILSGPYRSWRFGISGLDRAGKAPLVGGAIADSGAHRLDCLVDVAAGLLFSGRAVADLREVGAVPVDEANA